MKKLKSVCLIAIVGIMSHSFYAQTISPWRMHEGNEGVVNFKNNVNGDPRAYEKMSIPNQKDKGWAATPKDAAGNVYLDRSSTLVCLQQLDFTYFETVVNIPANMTINEFKVSYDKADDGARIYFFNSKFPNGTFEPKADLIISQGRDNSAAVNLKDKIAPGENRVVIVQFDDCADRNSVHNIKIAVNGKEVKPVAAASVADPSAAIATSTGNIAKGKSCKASSVNYGGDASRACDGNANGYYGSNSCTHTRDEKDPWWEVDLGAVYDVSSIKIWNRTDDCCWNRLQGFYVMASEQAIGTCNTAANFQYKGTSSYSFTSAGQTSMTLEGNKKCRYIRIWIPGNIKILSLAEVEVFGKLATAGVSTATIVATATALPDKFKIHAYSISEGQGDKDDYWLATNANSTKAVILSKAKLVNGSKWMEIESVNLGNDIYAFKVLNAGTDMYITVRDNKEVFVDKAAGGKIPDAAKFKSIKPLTSSKGANEQQYRSFESVKFSGQYLRHESFIMYVHPNNNTELFKQDASWLIQKM